MPPTRSITTLQKKNRTAISIDIKKEICEYMSSNPYITQVNVATFFNTKYNYLNIDRTTISKIWQKKEKWLNIQASSQNLQIYKQRSVQFPTLDKVMQIWTSQAVAARIPLTDMILQQKGLEFAKKLNIENQVKCGNGWIYKFKIRNGLKKVNFSGEANSAPLETLSQERIKLQALLNKYDKENIYNADETGLFFRMEPNQTLSTSAIAGHKKVNLKKS